MKMAPIHLFQFYLYSLCIHIFTIFVYLTYYSDLFTSSLYNQIKPHYDYIIGKFLFTCTLMKSFHLPNNGDTYIPNYLNNFSVSKPNLNFQLGLVQRVR